MEKVPTGRALYLNYFDYWDLGDRRRPRDRCRRWPRRRQTLIWWTARLER